MILVGAKLESGSLVDIMAPPGIVIFSEEERSSLEMIIGGGLSSEEVVKTAQLLLTDAERMQRLLSDLRMARIDLGSLPLNLQVVQPQPLIAEVIRSLTIQER